MSAKKVRLSLLISQTMKELLWVFAIIACTIGITYLFLTNRIALRGILLQQEVQKQKNLLQELSSLDRELSNKEKSSFLEKHEITKSMLK